MKRYLAVGVFMIMLASLQAGVPEEKWYPGSVVLNNQQVIVGEISVYAHHDLIMFRMGKNMVALPASKIESFFFYDVDANVNRKFISRAGAESMFHQRQLYEVVVTGTISVVRKQMALSRGKDDALDFSYFVLFENSLIDLKKFKRLVYPKISKQSKELLTFVKSGNLDPAQPAVAIQIIQHYNQNSIQETLAMR